MLLNKYIPIYQFNEIHKTIVNATPYETFNTTKNIDLSKSKIIEILFRLRGLPLNNHTLKEITNDMRFTLLEETPFSEFLYGFWFSSRTEWVVDLNEFIENNKKYNAKVGWSFCFNQRPNGTTEIITETRVLCMNITTRFLFSIYWFFIRPFSGLVRIEILKLIKNEIDQKNKAIIC